jgi:hypothetical protein
MKEARYLLTASSNGKRLATKGEVKRKAKRNQVTY